MYHVLLNNQNNRIHKIYSHLKPIISIIAGVPGSNLDGGLVNVVLSKRTCSIISPPV